MTDITNQGMNSQRNDAFIDSMLDASNVDSEQRQAAKDQLADLIEAEASRRELALLDDFEADMDTHEIAIQGNKMVYRANVELFITAKRQSLK